MKRRHFNWTTDFNISFNRNKVLALANNQSVLPADNLKIPNGGCIVYCEGGPAYRYDVRSPYRRSLSI